MSRKLANPRRENKILVYFAPEVREAIERECLAIELKTHRQKSRSEYVADAVTEWMQLKGMRITAGQGTGFKPMVEKKKLKDPIRGGQSA